ncbi:MAG: hypothetical protein IPI85_03530 [Dehalococcoidia bacterium]|jgi:hypothetical protein|uniref:hypothetical protein n=1 Tax=Candidatus Amarobacter glycogenicus TaxID=3140699 RepID=UPI0031356A0F|nr:hypothetical protein [Dehalococcoidia bacterium]MBK6562347.1 hypothetical protein [Dehalococcoidia bacterium]MBK7328187.1 hypothetical protein [Dehalococcoidia bacterium]MBK8560534.1 hypothetical protein [Dehalococcoidia bacterium]MCC6266088.1 hypothetical protein [Dehalococcoidia bacterium]
MSEHEHEHELGEGHGAPGVPHEPAPREQRRLIAEPPLLGRGLGLGLVAVGAGWLAVSMVRANALLVPLAAAVGTVSVLAGWAAAVHVTGGEKFDDHPFV